MTRRVKTVRKTYKRKKKGKDYNSESNAWTSVAYVTGMTKDQLVETKHTDTHWVFIVERYLPGLHQVYRNYQEIAESKMRR